MPTRLGLHSNYHTINYRRCKKNFGVMFITPSATPALLCRCVGCTSNNFGFCQISSKVSRLLAVSVYFTDYTTLSSEWFNRADCGCCEREKLGTTRDTPQEATTGNASSQGLLQLCGSSRVCSTLLICSSIRWRPVDTLKHEVHMIAM